MQLVGVNHKKMAVTIYYVKVCMRHPHVPKATNHQKEKERALCHKNVDAVSVLPMVVALVNKGLYVKNLNSPVCKTLMKYYQIDRDFFKFRRRCSLSNSANCLNKSTGRSMFMFFILTYVYVYNFVSSLVI